jgi:PAS domain S-box-containing protein
VPFNVKRFFLTIVLPTLLTIGLFMLLIFRFIIPYFEQNMLNQKKETIRELVSSSVSIAGTLWRQAGAGKMSEAEAQSAAILQIQNIRYGTGNKDYCWITDFRPRMIQHPYRPDLNGTDLSGFRDPQGKRLFVEMVQVVERNGAGYVDYMWQWMDDSSRIVPKISYVRGFKPWGWIIGTGIYIEDIRQEIAGIKKRLLLVLLLLSAAMALLLAFIVRQNLKTEMKRGAAERDLLESREKYKALVEASTEGTWMILQGATIYANKKLGEILPGCEQQAISDDFREIIAPDRQDDIQAVGDFSRGPATFFRLETRLQAPAKQPVDAMLSISKIVLSDKRGYIVIIKELGRQDEPSDAPGRELADVWGIGFFQVTPGKKGRFLDINPVAMSILGYNDRTELLAMNIADLAPDRGEWHSLLREINSQGAVSRFPMQVRTRDGTLRSTLISATVRRDEQGAITRISGILEDVSEQKSRQLAQQELVADIQSVLLLLQQPAGQVMREAVVCRENESIQNAAALMAHHGVDALLVRSEAGKPIGIVTDGDLRRRVVAKGSDSQLAVAAIMSSPLKTGSEILPLAQAWLEMKRAGIGHLVICDADKHVRGIVARGDFDCSPFLAPLPAQTEAEPPLLLAELRSQFLKLPELLDVFVRSHARSEWLTGLTTAVADRTASAIAGMVRRELGPPPVPFAFFVLGSEGRSEPTLFTDQDNALVYLDPPAPQAEACQRYFREFAERMNRMLAQTGYTLCPGQVMANNSRWNQPLSVWMRYFSAWVRQPDPQSLLESTTFFDLRRVDGDAEPIRQLQEFTRRALKDNPAFFGHLAQVCLQYKIPLGLFGKILTDASEPEHDRVNIKNPLRVIVNLLRLYAMAHGIEETNTALRLRRLHEQGVVSNSLFRDMDYAFDFLLGLQFRSQLRALRAQKPMSHSIALDELAGTEISVLKTIFSDITSFQSRLRHDFSIPE